MAHRNHLILLLLFVVPVIYSGNIIAQDNTYRLTPAPDIWYNEIDGIRLGVRILGEEEGTFKDGPHRLDAGFWVNTWFPDLPVSYYTSFTEPIPSISDFGSEGSIQAITSIRTGYSQHQLKLNKRWQPGFDEYVYHELSFFISQEKAIELEYRPYSQLWQNEWKSFVGINYQLSSNPNVGRFQGNLNLMQNVNDASGNFTVITSEIQQLFNLNSLFKLRLRAFMGATTGNTANEHQFMVSMNSAQNWLDGGISRAKGTIPHPWMDSGVFQVGGGANLRGYLNRDIISLRNGGLPVFESIIGFNAEIEFPNLINRKLKDIRILGDFIEMRTYLFFDTGKPDFIDPEQQNGNVLTETTFISDAGAGLQFSFNIPDYLGKDRGIFIRYDVPFWISDPAENESYFEYRQLIGIGAIISF